MRSYLTDLLRFTLLAMVVYTLVIILAGSVSPYSKHRNIKYARGGYGHLHTRLQEAEHVGPVDILFLGSSHAYRGFDPRVFRAHGLTTFVLGSSAQSPLQTKVLVERYLDRMRPKLVVMDVFPSTFNTEGVESSLNVLSNVEPDLDVLRMIMRTPHAATWNTAVFAVWRDLTGMNDGFSEPAYRAVDEDTYVSGGYVEKGAVPYEPSSTGRSLVWDPPALQWQAFVQLLTTLEGRGIPVVLVQTPVTKAWQFNSAERARLDSTFAPLATYMDLSDALMGNEDELFYDGHHMRQPAVERFNLLFLARLRSNGLLPEH